MGFIKLVGRKLFLIGIGIAVIGLVFVVAAIYFYIIQSVDSSKMNSFDYEIAKPIPLNKSPILNQSTQFNNKNEPPADTPNKQNKADAPAQKSNETSNPSSSQIQNNPINPKKCSGRSKYLLVNNIVNRSKKP